ncbi:hypothetical protein [Sphingobacterium sp. xlx-130]|uniref:hypothetical protein n=1 Tax=Sphingobacterium sp. xlx-130 TaxID=2654323 RepID=UPI001F09B5CA|nr:hypothetical protein [Sphingobacterium sp. xlx-130]
MRILSDYNRILRNIRQSKIIHEIKDNVLESRREWLIWMMEREGIEAGFVPEGHFLQYSSAIDYSGGRGLVKLEVL